MMKGALENVEVLHFFFISVLWGDLVLCPWHTPPPPPPSAYSHSSGINDKEEWIRRVVGGGVGGLDGKWTTPIKRIRLISGCRIAAYRCEQVHCRPTRFSLSCMCLLRHASPPHPPNTPLTSPKRGGGKKSFSCWNDKTEVKQLYEPWKQQCWRYGPSDTVDWKRISEFLFN